MSRITGIKACFPLIAIAIVVAGIALPALADQPLTPPGLAGKGTTSATATATPLFKIGNLHLPPAVDHNLTKQVKGAIDNIQLNITKKMAENKINLAIRQLELYEKSITYSSLSSSAKASIIAIADTNIQWYRQQAAYIQAAADLDTVQALMAQVDQQTAMLRVNMMKDAGTIACDELDARIATARNVSAVMAGKAAQLKAQGNDTAQPEQKIADLNAHIDAAGQYSADARAAFGSITGADNLNGGFREGYRQIGLADQEMSRAYADLKVLYLWYLHS